MIKVYSKPNCMQCDFTKKHLDRMGLEYQLVDVTTDQRALYECNKWASMVCRWLWLTVRRPGWATGRTSWIS